MSKTINQKEVKKQAKLKKKQIKKQDVIDLPGRGILLRKIKIIWGAIAVIGLLLVIIVYFAF